MWVSDRDKAQLYSELLTRRTDTCVISYEGYGGGGTTKIPHHFETVYLQKSVSDHANDMIQSFLEKIPYFYQHYYPAQDFCLMWALEQWASHHLLILTGLLDLCWPVRKWFCFNRLFYKYGIIFTFEVLNSIMNQRIAHIALVVNDYDEAIDFYTKKLEFLILEDTKIDEQKRWIIIAPPGSKECSLLLAKASNEEQKKCVGNQTGGRVFLFLFTDNFWRDFNKMAERNIEFVRPPSEFPYGMVAVFKDLYGNLWDLIEPNENNKGISI